tara:strand:- start:1050 stop:2843 length:1794 start_codon:yes stop_codon:yes gene_type:complete
MKDKKLIKYTSKDFNSIKSDLVDHAKRYYPNSYNDFREGSFGSLMFDSVAYVGDILSFYLDYQVNESFLETSIEYDNIRRHAKRYGYNFYGRPAAYGIATFYILIPAAASGLGPDTNYLLRIKTGTKLTANTGATFMLTEDVDFSSPKNEVVVGRVDDTTGRPTYYAVRATGQVKSGTLFRTNLTIGAFQRFRRELIGPSSVNEIISVYDSEGHRYYQVDYLSQNTVFMETVNKNSTSDGVKSLLKPFIVPRRFTIEQDSTGTYMVFGHGSSAEDSTTINVADPSSVALKLTGRDYITDRAFDPTKLLDTDTLGVAPESTTLTIVYGANDNNDVNVPTNSLTSIKELIYEFPDSSLVNPVQAAFVINSIESTNDQRIIGNTPTPSTDEIRIRSLGGYATQNRAVTREDYESYIYLMPPKFGSVKRASVVNDPSSSNRKLSLYIISEDSNNNLQLSNDTIKSNVKTWLNSSKMLNDSIDIYNPYIINVGFTFYVSVDSTYDKQLVLNNCFNTLNLMFNDKMYIGETLYVANIYKELNKLEGIIDVQNVIFNIKNAANYASSPISLNELLSNDGTHLNTPKNAIIEIKNPNLDIKGIAR